MLQKKHIYILSLAVILLWGTVSSPAYAFGTASQPASWGGASDAPAYQFRSTSTYTPVVGSTPYSSEIYSPGAAAPTSGPRRTGGAYSEEDEELGVLPDPSPVGEPFVLLAMAALYTLWLALQRRLRKN